MKTRSAKPFVKWVGGKTRLLDEVKKTLPCDLCLKKSFTYVESFVGGGAVLFYMLQEYPNMERVVINDINSELMCTYRIIRDDVHSLIDCLEQLQCEYIELDDEGRKVFFVEKRSLFNRHCVSDVEMAALFIFLNKTCFNGLYRVNSKGKFNVPHGKYANPTICDKENLLAVSSLLQRVEILCGDFSLTEQFAGVDVVYYLDPPYKPITHTSSFTSYAKEGFDDAEQLRLRDFCKRISNKGAQFIVSNSDPKEESGDSFFEQIYYSFRIKRVSAPRFVNANPQNRGLVSEVMISNVY